MDTDDNSANDSSTDENFLQKRTSRKPTILVGSTSVKLISELAYRRYIERTNNIAPYKRVNFASGKTTCTACEWQPPSFLASKHKRTFLTIHHLVSIADGGNDKDENLVIFCPNCHSLANYLPSIITLPHGPGRRTVLIKHLQLLNTEPDNWKAQYDVWKLHQMRSAVHSLQDKNDGYDGTILFCNYN